MPLPLYSLAVAVFAMGTSEFMLAGLLPDIAADLGVPIATAGLLTPAFAVGMAVGAPLMAAVARRWPRRSALLVFLGLFLAAHVAGAVTGGFAVLLAGRVIAALACAGFLAVALTTAAALVPADRKGRALAVLLAGTTVATVAGVPGGALLGTLLDWRATFWLVALLCLPSALGVARGVPAGAGRSAEDAAGTDLRGELARLRSPRLVQVLLLGALVNAATFGAFTFLAPVVTDVAGLEPLWVPVALVLFGLGSFAGVTVAGRLSDRRPGVVVAAGGPLLLGGWAVLGLLAPSPSALLILAFTQGALSFAVGSTLIARVLYEAAGAPTMAGSYATAALNAGAVIGPVAAAAALNTGAAALGPVWSAGVLVAVALVLALLFRGAVAGAPVRRPTRARGRSGWR
ncbi:chloramphenicol resistance protein [Sphaerisporangium krabiense]|uniref:DHA1 family chloramphenicol resistance protein-like MFS transporter n=1 Tax=Sphaerisporangium krabiense TaxID=763782 RepID=A0A7W9DQT4_9ACTN|nr:Cmx/CmrA family chloramphenicol efflux MFS transporter [Sphaerisporangium krabiense]MBB5627877.1 DHA1 family chloramphenicol resistance protein-like MFS transporter [Sphaerisporangium krabiense]GII62036.1 chloramphenicol resistance protein [Sphaerisporangium krabiense]